MNRADADQITTKLRHHFGQAATREALDAWWELLAELDVNIAWQTLRRLRDPKGPHDRMPSPATFHRLYISIAPKSQDDELGRCAYCHGNGWIEDPVDNHPQHWPGTTPAPARWEHTYIDPKSGTPRTIQGCNCNVAVVCPHCNDPKAIEARRTTNEKRRKKPAIQTREVQAIDFAAIKNQLQPRGRRG